MTTLRAVHQLGVAVTADEMTCSSSSCLNNEQLGRRIYRDVVIVLFVQELCSCRKRRGRNPEVGFFVLFMQIYLTSTEVPSTSVWSRVAPLYEVGF
jgi:hypothetical protein